MQIFKMNHIPNFNYNTGVRVAKYTAFTALAVGFFQQLGSFLLLTSQMRGNVRVTDIMESKNAIKNLNDVDGKIETIEIPVGTDLMAGILFHPTNQQKTNSIILQHNPQGGNVGDYFKSGSLLSHTALGRLANWFDLPVMYYDYRGAGLNSKHFSLKSPQNLALFATSETLIEDGKAALTYALQKYENVLVVGSSLGGAIGTISLNEYLKEHPADAGRVRLIHHDSFTAISEVARGRLPMGNYFSRLIGMEIDVREPMQNLLQLQVPVSIFCHDQDPMIPREARMANWIQTLPMASNLSMCRDTTNAVHVTLDASFLPDCAKNSPWLSTARDELLKGSVPANGGSVPTSGGSVPSGGGSVPPSSGGSVPSSGASSPTNGGSGSWVKGAASIGTLGIAAIVGGVWLRRSPKANQPQDKNRPQIRNPNPTSFEPKSYASHRKVC